MRIHKIVLFTAALIPLSTGIASATCNSANVRQNGRIITILPTNSDDTANLQCALDLGSQMPGGVVQLLEGTYITGRVEVDGFVGTVRGYGMNSTLIRNLDSPIYVTADDFYQISPESDTFAPPYLIVLLGGDYTVTDLSASIVGSEPATDWPIFGIRASLGHGIKSLTINVHVGTTRRGRLMGASFSSDTCVENLTMLRAAGRGRSIPST